MSSNKPVGAESQPIIHFSMVEDDGSALCWDGDCCPEVAPQISTDIREVTCSECKQHYGTLNDLAKVVKPKVGAESGAQPDPYEICARVAEDYYKTQDVPGSVKAIIGREIALAIRAAREVAKHSGERGRKDAGDESAERHRPSKPNNDGSSPSAHSINLNHVAEYWAEYHNSPVEEAPLDMCHFAESYKLRELAKHAPLQPAVTPEQLGKLARRIVEEYGLPLHGKVKLEKVAAILREELGGGTE